MSRVVEKTIVLKAAEVKAILAGGKFRKRVPVVLNKKVRQAYPRQRRVMAHDGISYVGPYSDKYPQIHVFQREGESKPCTVTCPFGAQGTELIVREPWSYAMAQSSGMYGDCLTRSIKEMIAYQAGPPVPNISWMPVHIGNSMPRSLSRITLLVRACGVERLLDIDDECAMAEGFDNRSHYEKVFRAQHGWDNWVKNPFMWAMDFGVIDHSDDVFEWQNTLRVMNGGEL